MRIELVPIDHGFCLPEALEAPFFEWLYWGQASAAPALLDSVFTCYVCSW